MPTYCVKQILHWSKLRLGFYMSTCGIFCMFFLFCNFWRCFFFLSVDSVLCNMSYRKGYPFLFSFFITLFKILFLCIISLRFLFFLHAVVGLRRNAFFSVGLIWNKCHCLSMIFLMFGRVLLNFSTSGILNLFAIFGFDVDKAYLVTFDIWLNWSIRKFPL